MKKRISFLVVGLALIILAMSVASVAYGQNKYGGTITEANGAEPTTLDVSKATRRPETTILNLICEPLFTMNKDLEVEPLLVETWEVSENGLEWTFHLKQGIKFHDGTSLNAKAVKFSMERNAEGNNSYLIGPLQNVTTQGEYTVVLTYSEPYPLLPVNFANYRTAIISPQTVEQYGEDYGLKAVSGTGPFRFKEWVSGESVTLERNEGYAHGPSFATNKGPAYADKWVFRFIAEPSTLVWELQEGNVDISTYIPEDKFDSLIADPSTEIVTMAAPSIIHLPINSSDDNPPFNDQRVREAVGHAINRDAVIKAALFGVGNACYTLVPPTVLFYWEGAEELGRQFAGYAPEKSRALLKEAGWIDQDGDGIREKDGEELKIDFFTYTITRYRRIAEVAQPMLEAVGFKVKLHVLESGTLYERVARGEHDLLATALMGRSLVSDILYSTCHSKYVGTLNNWFVYTNPELDERLEAMMSEKDNEVRAQMTNEAQEIVIRDSIAVPLCMPLDIFGYDPERIGGVDAYMQHPWAFRRIDALKALELYVVK